MLLALIILGVLLLTAMMVLVINPPDAWIKRMYSKNAPKSKDK